jgi:hypothetical protein
MTATLTSVSSFASIASAGVKLAIQEQKMVGITKLHGQITEL